MKRINMEELERLIIFENDNLIVVNKPAGIPVHGGTKSDYNLLNLFKQHKKYCELSLFLAHRLDKETSGCLILSKNIIYLRKIQKMFCKHLIVKEYNALVYGVTEPRFFIKTSCSVLHKYNKKIKDSDTVSFTRCETIFNYNGVSLLKIFPLTGKLHQIRIHLAYIGHPILCDNKYGNISLNKKFLGHNMFLHAKSISFKCPLSNQVILVYGRYPAKVSSLIRSVKSFF